MMDNQHQPNQCLFPRLRNWSFLLGLLLVLAFPNQALATTLPTRMWDIPHTGSNSFTTTVLLPDWSQISLQNFPPIGSDGAIESLGRIWSAGQTPDQFWQLGDIEEALKAEILSLATIEQLALNGTDLDNLALAAFPLVGEQTISHLIEIVPNLAQLSLAEVAPLSSLASQVLGNGEIPSLGSIPLAEVVSQFPAFAAASLNQINLAEFALSEIPNLANVSLEQFSGWQGQLLRDIPNLNLVPLNSFPNPVTEAGTAVMRIDALYSQAEQRRHHPVSGSDVEGFAVACESNCAHIELDELENAGSRYRSSMEGKQWISGKYQQVRGGHGCLAGVNGGREPTGRHPFGSLFKVVVEEPDETTDTVETAMYFRFSNSCGHTPYFIGPVPFLSYRVNAPIFLGALPENSMPPSSSSATQSIPTPEGQSLSSAVIKPPSPPLNQTLVPATYIEGVDVVELASAISALDGSNNQSYQAVGAYVCLEGSSNCGAALGRYQLMSGDEAVRAAIASVSGGVEFLTGRI